MRVNGGGKLALGHDIHAVDIDGDVVVLDLTREAYLCLPAASAPLSAPPPSLVTRLNEAGIPVAAAAKMPSFQPPPLPCADLGEEPIGRLTASDALDALRATFQVLRSYRGRRVSELIADFQASVGGAPASTPEVLALARRFNRWVVLAAVPDKCLVRSFMLMDFLRRNRVAATWVFGVRTWPFRAHCWVQHEDIVLDEHWERLIPYAPLLAVRS